MPSDLNISHQEAVEAGKICGALLFGYLWQLQQDSGRTVSLPMRPRSTKKYLSARESADRLGIRKSKFYQLKRDDPGFPEVKQTAGGEKYLAADMDRYDTKLKHKKA